MGQLDGKVALITGAGGGIGRAHARLFAHEGAAVVVNDTGGARDGAGTSGAAHQVVEQLRGEGLQAVASTDDISERAGAERAIATALATFGRIDILINNAGILRDKTLLKMDDEMWDAVLKVHVRGSYLCSQVAARWMVEHKVAGRILNTTSVSGLIGSFGQSNYAAAKAALYGLTRATHFELFPKYRITVNAIAPIALTRMTAGLPMMEALRESLPDAEELLAPEHVSPIALFLASDAAADISGVVVGAQGEQVSVYSMVQSSPLVPRTGKRWTSDELRERWGELTANEAS